VIAFGLHLNSTKGDPMASSPVDAVNLTQEQLVKSLIEKIRWNVEIAPFWPYRGVVGGLLRYARTGQLAAADMDDLATILADGADIADNTPAADQGVTYTLGELSSRYKIDYNAQDRWRYQNLDDVLAVIACMRCLLMSFRKLDLDAVPAATGDYPVTLRDVRPRPDRGRSWRGTHASLVAGDLAPGRRRNPPQRDHVQPQGQPGHHRGLQRGRAAPAGSGADVP